MVFFKNLDEADKRLKKLQEEGRVKEPYITDIAYNRILKKWKATCVLPTREIQIGGELSLDNGNFSSIIWNDKNRIILEDFEKRQIYDLYKKYHQDIVQKVKRLFEEGQ